MDTSAIFTYARFIADQNALDWQPLPVFIWTRKSLLTLAASPTKLFPLQDSEKMSTWEKKFKSQQLEEN